MSEKPRELTISFRPTAWERAEIETRVAMSGMKKREYIIRSCIYSNIVVVGKKENIQKIVDAVESMQQTMIEIGEQLTNGAVPLSEDGFQEMKMEYLALANTVVDILNGAAYLFNGAETGGEEKNAKRTEKTQGQ